MMDTIVPLADFYAATQQTQDIFDLLSQLTVAPLLDPARFEAIIAELNDNHQIFAYCKDDKVVGLITLLIEQKLIHGGACVAHIEDLVVDHSQMGAGIATRLVEFCLNEIKTRNYNCYKVVLACKPNLASFYAKCGFTQTNVEMAKYF